MVNYDSTVTFSQDPSVALLYELDQSRFYLNDRVLAEDIVWSPPHNQPRIEKIKLPDKIQFTSERTEADEEYTTKYPNVKHQLNIISAQQAKLPTVTMNINPGEQIQWLIKQGNFKKFYGLFCSNLSFSVITFQFDFRSVSVMLIICIIISNLHAVYRSIR